LRGEVRRLLPWVLATFVGTASAETHVVITKGMQFVPAEITVKAGDVVRWENRERTQYHSVFFKDLPDEKVNDYFFPGESRERTFATPGTYSYLCEPHWESHKMVGVVRVTD
jgi:plastocyanin